MQTLSFYAGHWDDILVAFLFMIVGGWILFFINRAVARSLRQRREVSPKDFAPDEENRRTEALVRALQGKIGQDPTKR